MTDHSDVSLGRSSDNPLTNHSAERAVLGAILIRPEESDALFERLEETNAFTLPANRMFFEAMLDLRRSGQPIDPVTLSDALKLRAEIDKVGGAVAIGALMREVHTTANAEAYVDILLDRARARHVFDVARRLSALDKSLEAEELVALATEITDRIGDDGADAFEAKAITEREIEDYVARAPDSGVKLFWEPMRKAFGRLDEDGELAVVAARPAVGKTSFGLSWALEEMRGGTHVGFLSLEKRRRQVVMRMCARLARIDLAKLTHGQDQKGRVLTPGEIRALAESGRQLAKMPFTLLTLEDKGLSPPTPMRVIRACKYLARRGAKLVFVDQLYRVRFEDVLPKGMRYGQVLGGFARRLQMDVAWKHKICVALLHQLGRGVERTDEPPKLSDLRDSGELEQDADRVMFLHRIQAEEGFQNSEFIVAKSSDGWKGSFGTYFAAACAGYFASQFDEGKTFYNRTDEEAEDDGRYGGGQTEAF